MGYFCEREKTVGPKNCQTEKMSSCTYAAVVYAMVSEQQ